jgi:hypothetical protein
MDGTTWFASRYEKGCGLVMTSTPPTTTPWIDWNLIGHIVAYAAVAGIGLVALFSLGVFSYAQTRATVNSSGRRAMGIIGTIVSGAALATALAWGFYLIVAKG